MTSTSKKKTAKTSTQKTIPPVRPNAGVEAWYRRQLDKQIREMQKSVVYWLTANYKASGAAVAMDASPAVFMRDAMKKLAKRWTKSFDSIASKLAERFAGDAMKNSDVSLHNALDTAGFTVEFKMTAPMNNALQATIAENVGLIRSIPEKYFTEVEGLVMRSVARGRDLSYLTDELQKALRHHPETGGADCSRSECESYFRYAISQAKELRHNAWDMEAFACWQGATPVSCQI
jgi:uncharacterized protein with gpF-like domain